MSVLLSQKMGVNGSNHSIFYSFTVDLLWIHQTYSGNEGKTSLSPFGESIERKRVVWHRKILSKGTSASFVYHRGNYEHGKVCHLVDLVDSFF